MEGKEKVDGSENSLNIPFYIGLSLDSCKCFTYSKQIKIRLKSSVPGDYQIVCWICESGI